MERAAKIAFLANKAYYDACIELKGQVDASNVDFDSYAYFELLSVPSNIDFDSTRKSLQNPKTRVNELWKYLCFMTPDGLDIAEKKDSRSVGYKATIELLKEYNIESSIRWSFKE